MEKKNFDEQENQEKSSLGKKQLKAVKIKTLITAIVFAAIGAGLTAVFWAISGFLGAIVAGVFVITLIIWPIGESKRIKRSFCRECSAKYNYDTCIEWEVTDVDIKEKRTDPNKTGKQVAGVRIETVAFTCTCEECGDVQYFTQKYQTGTLYDNGNIKAKKLEPMIKKYFIK